MVPKFESLYNDKHNVWLKANLYANIDNNGASPDDLKPIVIKADDQKAIELTTDVTEHLRTDLWQSTAQHPAIFIERHTSDGDWQSKLGSRWNTDIADFKSIVRPLTYFL